MGTLSASSKRSGAPWRPPRGGGPSPRALQGSSPKSRRPAAVVVEEIPEAEAYASAAGAGRPPRRASDSSASTASPLSSRSPGAVSYQIITGGTPEPRRQLRDDRDELATAFQDFGRASPQQRRQATAAPEPWQQEAELAEMQVSLVEKEAEIARLRNLVRMDLGKLAADARALRASSAIISRQVNTMRSGIGEEMHDAKGTLLVRMSESLRATAAHHEDVGKEAMMPELWELQNKIRDLEAAKWGLETDLAAREGDLATRDSDLRQAKAESQQLRNTIQELRDAMHKAASAHEDAMAVKEDELARLQSSVSGEVHRVLDELRQIKEADSPSSRGRSRSNSPSLPLSPSPAADAVPSASPITEPVVNMSPQLHHSPSTPSNAMSRAFEAPQDWAQIITLAHEQPELLHAPCDNEGAGMLALHLCVILKAPLNVTRAVFEQNPEAIGVKDTVRGVTPIELIVEAETSAAPAGQAQAFDLTATYLRAAHAMIEATRNGEMGVLEVYASLVRTVSGTPPMGWS